METNTNESTDGVHEIPGRRSDGVAGASREVSGMDGMASSTDGAGQKNNGTLNLKSDGTNPGLTRKSAAAGSGMDGT